MDVSGIHPITNGYGSSRLPEIDQDLFGRIDKIIQARPEEFGMEGWELRRPTIIVDHRVAMDSCHTTRCVAGWAIHLTATDQGSQANSLHDMLKELVGQNEFGDPAHHYERAARELLGLTHRESSRLFYTSDERGARLVHAYATGGRPAAMELFREFGWPVETD